MSREHISACLIVQNEQERLPDALASVTFCDEIIVVDGGSTDRTVELARAAGARVIENPWPGFAAQRNVALDAATGHWILEVDADERVSPSLRSSIEALLTDPPAGVGMAVCALRNRFLGGPLGPSAKYPAYRSRLFRRGSYRHDETRTVHEGVEPHERPLVLEGDLEHELAATLEEALLDTWQYARLESLHIEAPLSARSYVVGIALRPTTKWIYRTLLEGGWRDGWRGLLKISLDATSDALVWALVLGRVGRNSAGGNSPTGAEHESNGAGGGHFGRRRTGPVKIVALADHGHSARAATRWLAGLREQGIDIALISSEPDTTRARSGGVNEQGLSAAALTGTDIPRHSVKHLGPLAVMHALEIETQIRAIDAVVPVGRRARLVHHLLPGALRPEIDGLSIEMNPEQAAERASAAVALHPR